MEMQNSRRARAVRQRCYERGSREGVEFWDCTARRSTAVRVRCVDRFHPLTVELMEDNGRLLRPAACRSVKMSLMSFLALQ